MSDNNEYHYINLPKYLSEFEQPSLHRSHAFLVTMGVAALVDCLITPWVTVIPSENFRPESRYHVRHHAEFWA